jgi:preprotein translocase subunit YajC
MKSCCSHSNGKTSWISHLIMAVALVSIVYLVFGRAHPGSLAYLPVLSVLVCPIMMFFMMYMMVKPRASAPRDTDASAGHNQAE